MTFLCECCPKTADQPVRYFLHLLLAHETGVLARAVEPSLFGTPTLDESPPNRPRVWDRWDKGGRNGPVRRTHAPAPERLAS